MSRLLQTIRSTSRIVARQPLLTRPLLSLPHRFLTLSPRVQSGAPASGTEKSDEPAAAAAAAASAPSAKEKELTEQLAKKDEQIKELKDQYMRQLAETENVRTRGINQVADAKKFAVQSFAKSLLEVADVLEMAVKTTEEQGKAIDHPAFKNLLEGVAMTQKVLQQVFERNQLKKFEPLNEKFDPHFHEGIYQVEDGSKPHNTVINVMKSGYKLNDRCLRAAQVGTTKLPANQESK